MSDFAVWAPTAETIEMATRLKDRFALKTLKGHAEWRASQRKRAARDRYVPENFRGDVDSVRHRRALDASGKPRKHNGIHQSGESWIEIVNALGVVDWHDDEGFPRYTNFLVLRNRHYEVKQRGSKRINDQPFGCIIRLNVLTTHALHPCKGREKSGLDHGLWLAAGFSTSEKLEVEEIVGTFNRSL